MRRKIYTITETEIGWVRSATSCGDYERLLEWAKMSFGLDEEQIQELRTEGHLEGDDYISYDLVEGVVIED